MKPRILTLLISLALFVGACQTAEPVVGLTGSPTFTPMPQPTTASFSPASDKWLLQKYNAIVLRAIGDPTARVALVHQGFTETGDLRIAVQSVGYTYVVPEQLAEIHWKEIPGFQTGDVVFTFPPKKWEIEEFVYSDQVIPLSDLYTCVSTTHYEPGQVCLAPGESIELNFLDWQGLGAEITNLGLADDSPWPKVEAQKKGPAPTPDYNPHYSFMGIRWNQHKDGTVLVRYNPKKWEISEKK